MLQKVLMKYQLSYIGLNSLQEKQFVNKYLQLQLQLIHPYCLLGLQHSLLLLSRVLNQDNLNYYLDQNLKKIQYLEINLNYKEGKKLI